jgi:MYXO-CTERM domain-containing protein
MQGSMRKTFHPVSMFVVVVAVGLSAATDGSAYGEPQDGFPSWSERMNMVMANRARCDPAADLADCSVCAEAGCYDPVPPLGWSYDLNRAARFHAANLVSCSCGLMHASPCTLVDGIGDLYTPGSCDGSSSCACVGGTCPCDGGTGTWDRISAFGATGSAENAASGGDPWSVHYMWLHEADSDSSCGWRVANGHRANILGGSRQLGVGQDGYWVQDFSAGGSVHSIASGAHYPNATGPDVEFRANWYDADAPSAAMVNVEGTCHPMTRERGSDENGTFIWTGPADGSCPRYFFIFKQADGTEVYYPDTGSFAVGSGCEDWSSSRPPTGDDCDYSYVPPDEGGCGCTVVGHDDRGTGLLAVLGLVAVFGLVARRRRAS